MGDTPAQLAKITTDKYSEDRKTANQVPLGAVGSVEDLIALYRGAPEAVRAGIQASILGAVGLAAALSMIPFESNFASHFAGSMLRDLASPGVSVAINAPVYDYLENLFPVKELAVRQLVQGIETGALSDADLIETAVDSGYKDREIVKLVKISKVARFTKETADDYTMLDRYQDAIISAQITNARTDIDDAIAAREAEIKEWQKIEREQALKGVAE